MFIPTPLRRNLGAALRDIHSSKPEVRASAARDLAIAGQDDPIASADALAPLTSDASPAVREAALLAIGSLGARHQLAALEGALEDSESRVRQSAVIALGEIGGERAREVLERASESERADVRFQALIALATADPRRGFERALASIHDEDPWVASEAASQLGVLLGAGSEGEGFTEIDKARAREALRTRLDHDSGRVALCAALALGRLGDERGHKTIVAFVRGEHEVEGDDASELRLEAIAHLGATGGPGAAEALAHYAWRLLPSLERAVARAALARLGDARAITEIVSALRSFWWSTREGAVRLAAAGRVREAVPDLAKLLATRRADPFAIIDALAAIGGDEARAALEAAATDARYTDEIRDAAREALAASANQSEVSS